jgi:alpha-D-xyloside xylohydrolase
VRAVPIGGAIRDDLVSALLPPTDGFIAGPGACASVTIGAPGQSVTSGNLRAELGADGRLSFTRLHDSKLLLSEATPRSLAPTNTTPPLPGFLGLNVTFKAVADERIYGLGQHKTGTLDNKQAGKLSLAPRNTEILIPVAHSSLGYAFLMNLPGFGSVEFGDTLTSWQLDTVLQADFWVATTDPPAAQGPEVSPWAQLQHSYANATGHSPVYPQWTSGYWQCKNRYHNQTQVMDVACA